MRGRRGGSAAVTGRHCGAAEEAVSGRRGGLRPTAGRRSADRARTAALRTDRMSGECETRTPAKTRDNRVSLAPTHPVLMHCS